MGRRFWLLVARITSDLGSILKMVPKVITNAMNNQTIPVYGSGKQGERQLYVSDHCEAIVTLISKGEPGEVYNIAAQNELTNLETIESLTDIVGDKGTLSNMLMIGLVTISDTALMIRR